MVFEYLGITIMSGHTDSVRDSKQSLKVDRRCEVICQIEQHMKNASEILQRKNDKHMQQNSAQLGAQCS
jgi:hypothetical protein